MLCMPPGWKLLNAILDEIAELGLLNVSRYNISSRGLGSGVWSPEPPDIELFASLAASTKFISRL